MNNLICANCGSSSNDFEMRDVKRLYTGEGFKFYLPITIPFCKHCNTPLYDEEIENNIAKIAHKKIVEQKTLK